MKHINKELPGGQMLSFDVETDSRTSGTFSGTISNISLFRVQFTSDTTIGKRLANKLNRQRIKKPISGINLCTGWVDGVGWQVTAEPST